MTVRGTISRIPRLTLDEWLRYVASRADLIAPQPRIIPNPFKSGAATLCTPEPGDVRLLLNDTTVGGIAPGVEFADDGQLDVFYPDEHELFVRNVAESVAKDLQAVIAWDDQR